eukprot:Nk52_evm26s2657 gene=Nk52_evmTU26s2657
MNWNGGRRNRALNKTTKKYQRDFFDRRRNAKKNNQGSTCAKKKRPIKEAAFPPDITGMKHADWKYFSDDIKAIKLSNNLTVGDALVKKGTAANSCAIAEIKKNGSNTCIPSRLLSPSTEIESVLQFQEPIGFDECNDANECESEFTFKMPKTMKDRLFQNHENPKNSEQDDTQNLCSPEFSEANDFPRVKGQRSSTFPVVPILGCNDEFVSLRRTNKFSCSNTLHTMDVEAKDGLAEHTLSIPNSFNDSKDKSSMATAAMSHASDLKRQSSENEPPTKMEMEKSDTSSEQYQPLYDKMILMEKKLDELHGHLARTAKANVVEAAVNAVPDISTKSVQAELGVAAQGKKIRHLESENAKLYEQLDSVCNCNEWLKLKITVLEIDANTN